jgi:hypothetical protein
VIDRSRREVTVLEKGKPNPGHGFARNGTVQEQCSRGWGPIGTDGEGRDTTGMDLTGSRRKGQQQVLNRSLRPIQSCSAARAAIRAGGDRPACSPTGVSSLHN